MNPLSVLVVDDDFYVAKVHAVVVEATPGYVVQGVARTAEETIGAVAAARPDLVLMDVHLPDGNGLDVVRSLLAMDDPPGVIVISAAKEIATVRQAMQLGAFHYLVKPFDMQSLTEQLTSYRRLRERLAQLGTADTADQSTVDELFRLRAAEQTAPTLPGRIAKGHSAPTLELVLDAVRAACPDASAAEVAASVGLSRATAQRYLAYLEEHGLVVHGLRYGVAGRPEHRYRAVDRGRRG